MYRQNINIFPRIAALLRKKLQKGQTNWSLYHEKDEIDNFHRITAAMISPSMLGLAKSGYHYTLDTDATSVQVGCCFMQDQADRSNIPIHYWRRALIKTEQKYTVTDKECLPFVWSMLTGCLNLYGTKLTDYDPWRWVLGFAEASALFVRFGLRLLELYNEL